MDKFYILSTGRVGSTYLANLIQDLDDNVGELHQSRLSRPTNVLSNIDLAFSTQLVSYFLSQDVLPSTADPQLSIHLFNRLTRKHLDSVRVVHLVRDPRDFVTSMMNWKQRRFQSRVSHHLIPFWTPSPIFHGVSVVDYLRMSKFEQFAWTWRFKNELFASLSEFKVSYRRFRTEDITSSSDELHELVTYLGLKGREKYYSREMNASRMGQFPKWRNWSKDQKAILNRHCSELMIQYGYGLEPEWNQL